MVDTLAASTAQHIRIFGGRGGTITPDEIRELEAYLVDRIYHPNDGLRLGLVAMIDDVVERARRAASARSRASVGPRHAAAPPLNDLLSIAAGLSAIERHAYDEADLARQRIAWGRAGAATPVVGITGTGGATPLDRFQRRCTRWAANTAGACSRRTDLRRPKGHSVDVKGK